MKKFLGFILVFLASLTLIACGNNTEDTPDYSLDDVVEELSDIYAEGDNLESVTLELDLKLESELLPEATITWISSNPLVIGHDGAVYRSIGEDRRIQLTLSVGNNGEVVKSYFILNVKGLKGQNLTHDYLIDFGDEEHTGYGEGEITFTNGDNASYTINKDRAQINKSTFEPHDESDAILVLAPVKDSTESFVEFEIDFIEEITEVQFDISVWNQNRFQTIKQLEDSLLTIQTLSDEVDSEGNNIWVTVTKTNLEEVENVNFIDELVLNEYATVSFSGEIGSKFRIVYNAPNAGTGNTNFAITVDNLVISSEYFQEEFREVTYDLGYLTINRTNTIQVINNRPFSAPVAPTRDGFVFAGWYERGSDESYEFGQPYTKKLTLTAKWDKLSSFSIDSESADIITAKEDDYVIGDKIELKFNIPLKKVLKEFKVNDTIIDNDEVIDGIYTLTMGENDIIVSAVLEDMEDAENHSILTLPETITSNQESAIVKNATEVILTITPEEGYIIDKLLLNETDVTANVIDNVYTFTMTEDTNLEVTYVMDSASNVSALFEAIDPREALTGDVTAKFGLDEDIFEVVATEGNIGFYGELRFYDGTTLTITVKEGYVIKGLTIGTINANAAGGQVTIGETVQTIDTVVEFTELDTQTIEIKNITSAQVKIQDFTIFYTLA